MPSPEETVTHTPTATNRGTQFLREIGPVRWLYRNLWFLVHSPSWRRARWNVLRASSFGPADRGAGAADWDEPFETLRKKWAEVPTDVARIQVPQLMGMGDRALLEYWENARKTGLTGEYFSRRGWYHLLYEPLIRGARVMDFGSGLGMDGLSFASWAEHVTCVDIAAENLALLKRIAGLKGLSNVSFVYIENYEGFKQLEDSYDVVLASGSLHHAPQKVIRREIHELARCLRIGGRWLQLAYPEARWERDGRLPFNEWGAITDGQGTPWAEWYDLEKLQEMFAPMEFEPVMAFNYHNDDFNWFELVRRS